MSMVVQDEDNQLDVAEMGSKEEYYYSDEENNVDVIDIDDDFKDGE